MADEKKAPRLKTVGLALETWKELKRYALDEDLSLSEAVNQLLRLKDEALSTSQGAAPKNQQSQNEEAGRH